MLTLLKGMAPTLIILRVSAGYTNPATVEFSQSAHLSTSLGFRSTLTQHSIQDRSEGWSTTGDEMQEESSSALRSKIV